MIVDTSALVAILREEPEAPVFIAILRDSSSNAISAGNWIEFAAVDTQRFDGLLDQDARDLLAITNMTIEPVTATQAEIGQTAYRAYGRGSGHRARLNFGDCFAYALAKERGEPLLFKGDDFIHTDIVAAA